MSDDDLEDSRKFFRNENDPAQCQNEQYCADGHAPGRWSSVIFISQGEVGAKVVRVSRGLDEQKCAIEENRHGADKDELGIGEIRPNCRFRKIWKHERKN